MKRSILALALVFAGVTAAFAQSTSPVKMCCFKCCGNIPPAATPVPKKVK